EEIEKTPTALNGLIGAAAKKSVEFQSDVVAGIAQGLNGWRRAPKPAAWDALVAAIGPSAPEALLTKVRELNLVFGDGRALDDVKAIVLNGKADLASRQAALRALIDQRPPDLQKICQQVLRVRFLNTVAVRGLALFDDPAI